MKKNAMIEYLSKAGKLNKEHFSLIRDFYESWQFEYPLNLKFRFIKLFAKDFNSNKCYWLRLDHFLNRRRINNKELKSYLLNLISERILPLRIFHSIAEWLAPEYVNHHQKNHEARMINTGFLLLENDINLTESIKVAKILSQTLKGEKFFIFSGNKSIHTWWLDYNPENYLKREQRNYLFLDYEKYDLKARKNVFAKIAKENNLVLDDRAALDTRRIAPIVGSLNAFTGRKVINVTNSIGTLTVDEVIDKSTVFKNWI